MDMENLIADTVLVTARTGGEGAGGKGRSKKWQEYLELPTPHEALPLKKDIEMTYSSTVEQQPIGEKLFHCFCDQHPVLSPCTRFLAALDELETLAEEKSRERAREIYREYIATESKSRAAVVTDEAAKTVASLLDDEVMVLPAEVFSECQRQILEFLKGEPFSHFLDSPYFMRYLQWKGLESQPINKDFFRQYRVLGKGGFGLVLACQSKSTGRMYAMKKLEKKRMKKKKGEKLALNEKKILEHVNSRFVVNLIYAFQTKHELCMILTLMNGGDLRFHIHHMGKPGLSPERTMFYAAELTLGLQHLHDARVAYRDMKPENILVDDFGHVRISDLGLAVLIPEGQSVRGRVGTVGYMAPEVVKHQKYVFAPDWFGLGCVVYEMVAGNSPFRKFKEKVTRDEVERRVQEVEEEYSDKFSEEAKLLCKQLLAKDPKTRLGGVRGAAEVKAHPFYSMMSWKHLEAGLVQPLFVPDPKCVYTKNVLDIEQFSSVKGVSIDMADDDFYGKFATGSSSIPWQKEMLETGAFDEVNMLNAMDGLMLPKPSHKVEPYQPGFFQKLFGKKKKKVSHLASLSLASLPIIDQPDDIHDNGDDDQRQRGEVEGSSGEPPSSLPTPLDSNEQRSS